VATKDLVRDFYGMKEAPLSRLGKEMEARLRSPLGSAALAEYRARAEYLKGKELARKDLARAKKTTLWMDYPQWTWKFWKGEQSAGDLAHDQRLRASRVYHGNKGIHSSLLETFGYAEGLEAFSQKKERAARKAEKDAALEEFMTEQKGKLEKK
tara:strand:+ start:1321 stop:1782 length:462 start_codon:yes stop_codon:yes gene_type:complete